MNGFAREAVEPGAIAAACNALDPVLGRRLRKGRDDREQHTHTTTWIASQLPDAVAFVETTDEVVAVIQICSAHDVPVVAFGTGTSLEGHVNAPYGGICVDLSSMNRLIEINEDDLDCVVEPGMTRKQLNSALRGTGLFFLSTPAPMPVLAAWPRPERRERMQCATAR